MYCGIFYEGKADGHGRFDHANGSSYEGSWIADMRNGKGKETLASGAVYEGDWEDGLR